ncbi:ribosome maturation factor RimM [Halomonas sp. WWR20]
MPSETSNAVQHGSDEYVVLGKLTSPHGVKGWLKVYSYTSPMESILEYPEWMLLLRGERTSLRLVQGRRQGKGLVAELEGITSREQAEQLAGTEILLPKDVLPELDEGDYYWHQLEGLKVVTLQGVCLGQVSYLFETGANDVLVVKATSDSLDERERLLPFLPDEVIHDVDLNTATLTVDWDPEF